MRRPTGRRASPIDVTAARDVLLVSRGDAETRRRQGPDQVRGDGWDAICQLGPMPKLTRVAVPLLKAEDVIPHLGKPTHWKQGRSAKAVADSWFQANDLPPRVRAVLDQSAELKGAELIDAWLERCTDLGDQRGTATQTDLLAALGAGDELAVMAVEAKVTESFGPLVSEWIGEGGEGRRTGSNGCATCLALIATTSATCVTNCSTALPRRFTRRAATGRRRRC